MCADGRAGYQDYIHNLDKLTVYIDVDSHRNYYTRRYGGGGRRSGTKRSAAATADRGHLAGTVCGVRTRAAVATAAGDGHTALGGDLPLAAPFPARIHLPCHQPVVGRFVFVEASGVESRYSRLFGAILCDVVVYQ